MATYTAVVTLMQDLEQLLISYCEIFGLEQKFCPFTKEGIEILYHSVSLMDSLLRDSSGESYNRELMTQILEERIRDVTRKAQSCVDFWIVESLEQFLWTEQMLARPLTPLIEDTAKHFLFLEWTRRCTLSEKLKDIQNRQKLQENRQKIHDDREVQDLEVISSPGTSLTFLSPSRRTPNMVGRVVGPDKDSKTISISYTNDIKELVIWALRNILASIMFRVFYPTNQSGGLAQKDITKERNSVSQKLDEILCNRMAQDFEVISSPGTSLTFLSSSRRTPNAEGKVVGPDKDLEAIFKSYHTIEIMKAIFRKELQKACNAIEAQVLELPHSRGTSLIFSSPSRRTPYAEFKVVGPNEDFEAIFGNYTITEIMEAIITEEVQKTHNAIKDRVSVLLAPSGGLTMNEITEEIISIKEELEKILDDTKVQDLEVTSTPGKSLAFLTPSRITPNTESKVVGLDKDLETMLDSLTGYPSQLKVFSIIGMAGIGKTTFAQTLYDSPHVMHRFYVRAWVSISQQYQLREVLLRILCCVTNVSDGFYGKSDEELREQLYRSLKGMRYLIILDDIWDTKAWDDLKRILPDDRNGSRIMLTSRLRDVAVHASQDTPPHCLRGLSMDESWELLSSKIFVDEYCPMELVAIGKQIACKCQGLPLAIVVVGGLLAKMNRKVDVWEEVARSVSSLVMEKAEHCQNILALSYSHLPDQLKACFLYMGIFPEDHEIPIKKLIWLWIAEGFIKPSMLRSLEEVADDYLKDLTTRSLIMVKRRSSDGRIKTCYIHDLMRELCLRESQKHNFFHVINSHGYRKVPSGYLHNLRRLSFHSSIHEYVGKGSFPYSCSVMCFEKLSASGHRSYLSMNFRLLKVLNIMSIQLKAIPVEMSNLTQLKFLALTIQCSLPMDLLLTFCKLQTIIVDCEWDGHLPSVFWDMLELRHFHLKRSCLSYSPPSFWCPSTSIFEQPGPRLHLRVQNNLQSLSTIRPMSCTSKVFLSMPNLKKLGIYATEEDYKFRGWFDNLVLLGKLEKLKYVFCNPFIRSHLKPDRLPSWDSFPPKLVKLTLSGTSLPWEDMSKLSMLPNLEVLKLRNYAFSGAVWKCTEGGFRCLKFLLIGSTNLEIWEAERSNFQSLRHLVLRHCRSLKEIPCGIGEAPLLGKIELHCCKNSAVESAKQLREEQQNLGIDELVIQITER